MTTVDLNRVATFIRVVDSGSFTSAAAELGLPKSSVSRAVARLEEDLGVRLLQRTTRRLGLTEAGQAFYERSREGLGTLSTAVAEAADSGKEPRGLVRVTAPVDLGVIGLAEAIAEFTRDRPQIQVELALTSRYVDLVREGFDLAVRAGSLADSTLIARRVAGLASGLFASPAYLRRHGRPTTLAALAGHTCVLFRARGGRDRWQLRGPAGDEAIEVAGSICADDLMFVQQCVLSGAGVGLFPLFMAARGLHAGTIERVLPDYHVEGAPLHLVVPSGRYVPARVALLRDHLAASLAALTRCEGRAAAYGRTARRRKTGT